MSARTCVDCGTTLAPNSSSKARCWDCWLLITDDAPWVCECDHPAADGLGECVDCHRLVMSHSRHAGRPPIPVHPENVTDVVPGEAFWDARDRRFYFIDANPAPDLDPTQRLIPLTVAGEGVQDYDRRHSLLVADDPRAAELANTTERVA